MTEEVVFITRKGQYKGRIGWAQPRRPGWETVTVEFGDYLRVQFLPSDFRLLDPENDRVVDP